MRLDLTGWTVGVELEGVLVSHNPDRVEQLIARSAADPEALAIGLEPEAGRQQFELHSEAMPLLAAEVPLGQWAERVSRFFARRLANPLFCSVSPYYDPQFGAPTIPEESSPRCQAFHAALDEFVGEPGRGRRLFAQVSGHNALHFHLRPPHWKSEDFFGPAGVAIVNAFAGQGLRFWFEAAHLADRGCIHLPPRYDREEFWRLAPGRGPTSGPYTEQSLIERWTRIPRLVRRAGNLWFPDLGLPTLDEVCRTGLQGTVWERVRPSPARSDKPATIELRLWGAVRPEAVAWVLINQVIPTLESIKV